MGRGNSEGVDGPLARKSHVFVSDSLSVKNINNLEHDSIEWVQLRSELGFRRFKTVLENLKIPHGKLLPGDVQENATRLFKDIFRE